MATILKRLHRDDHFETADDAEAFERKLQSLLGRGRLQEVKPIRPLYHGPMMFERWIRDPKADTVYRYVAPDFPMPGMWAEVERPEVPSYFLALGKRTQVPQADYDLLVRKLDEALARGEIERAYDMKTGYTKPGIRGITYYYSEPTDEAFQLVPPFEPLKLALWNKVFASKKDGTWPGELKLG